MRYTMSVLSGMRAVVAMRPVAAHACHIPTVLMQRASPSAAFLGAFRLARGFRSRGDAVGEPRAARP
jgi:hypothetical protein